MNERGLLRFGPDVPGDQQMTLDREMAEQSVRDGRVRVRFYRFLPPCVSLGHHQKEEDLDLEACRAHGFHVVRRPTGGRAVLHKGDLVYSLTARVEEDEEGGSFHKGIYNQVSLALARGFEGLGIEVGTPLERQMLASGDPDLPKLCFSSATRHEVQIGGRKLVGSAQRRLRRAVLQHGSILVTDEHADIVEVLAGLAPPKREALRKAIVRRTATLRQDAGYDGSFRELAEGLAAGFQEVFGPLERQG